MDRGNVEPNHWLHQNQSGLQKLLRFTSVVASSGNGAEKLRNGFKLALHEHALVIPQEWKKPRTIFVNSMSDLFHKDVPLAFIQQIFTVMHQANWHRYQILTKRSERLHAVSHKLSWSPHIWMGVSIENADYV